MLIIQGGWLRRKRYRNKKGSKEQPRRQTKAAALCSLAKGGIAWCTLCTGAGSRTRTGSCRTGNSAAANSAQEPKNVWRRGLKKVKAPTKSEGKELVAGLEPATCALRTTKARICAVLQRLCWLAKCGLSSFCV